MTKSLGTYLKESIEAGAIDHVLRASVDATGKLTFYIHPHGKDGDTQDYEVDENRLFCLEQGTVAEQLPTPCPHQCRDWSCGQYPAYSRKCPPHKKIYPLLRPSACTIFCSIDPDSTDKEAIT
ncbi:MAG: hypothetical protein V3V85_03375 [Candidatus Thorarchaeota archaeon]